MRFSSLRYSTMGHFSAPLPSPCRVSASNNLIRHKALNLLPNLAFRDPRLFQPRYCPVSMSSSGTARA